MHLGPTPEFLKALFLTKAYCLPALIYDLLPGDGAAVGLSLKQSKGPAVGPRFENIRPNVRIRRPYASSHAA
jgi:hypothetical protein